MFDVLSDFKNKFWAEIKYNAAINLMSINEEVAINQLKEAGEAGHIQANEKLAEIYKKDTQLQTHYKELYEKFSAAAAKDYDLGIELYKQKNFEKAVSLFQSAAIKGYALAQFNLGCCYSEGIGVILNKEIAVNCFRFAAEKNIDEAQYNLGICYLNEIGVSKKDEEKGVYWLERAVAEKHLNAKFHLGVCYLNGTGVPKNDNNALIFFAMAASEGHSDAKVLVDFITKKMNVSKKIVITLKTSNDTENTQKKNTKKTRKPRRVNVNRNLEQISQPTSLPSPAKSKLDDVKKSEPSSLSNTLEPTPQELPTKNDSAPALLQTSQESTQSNEILSMEKQSVLIENNENDKRLIQANVDKTLEKNSISIISEEILNKEEVEELFSGNQIISISKAKVFIRVITECQTLEELSQICRNQNFKGHKLKENVLQALQEWFKENHYQNFSEIIASKISQLKSINQKTQDKSKLDDVKKSEPSSLSNSLEPILNQTLDITEIDKETETYNLEALQNLSESADNGDIYAQCVIADHYFNTKNYPLAFKYYEMAAKQQFPYAEYALGLLYIRGLGVSKDEKIAFIYFEAAAIQGDPFACNYVGCCYLRGIGVNKNEEIALQYFLTAAMANFSIPEALHDLGIRYLEGDQEIMKDPEIGMEYIQRAKDQTIALARYTLGNYFFEEQQPNQEFLNEFTQQENIKIQHNDSLNEQKPNFNWHFFRHRSKSTNELLNTQNQIQRKRSHSESSLTLKK